MKFIFIVIFILISCKKEKKIEKRVQNSIKDTTIVKINDGDTIITLPVIKISDKDSSAAKN